MDNSKLLAMAAFDFDTLTEDSHRAFCGTPDLQHYVQLDSVEEEIRSLLNAVMRGDGIVVLTAVPGAGKTVVCRRLQAKLADRFEAVLLSSSEFATRRSLLQAILFELGEAYEGFTEQELRLAILNHARRNSSDRWGIVLIVDEAHLLNPRLLEELRCLTNHSDNGKSLIRVVLSAQLALEELLTQPALQALNYRITCHSTLEPISMQESAKLVAGRLQHVGRQVNRVFTADALETICRVSDGNPRCLIQLCDHTLSLPDATDDEPIAVDVVRRALQDLKQLPLHWNTSMTDQPIDLGEKENHHADRDEASPGEHGGLPSNYCSGPLADSEEPAESDDTWIQGEIPEWTNDVPSVEVGAGNEVDRPSQPRLSTENGNTCQDSQETERSYRSQGDRNGADCRPAATSKECEVNGKGTSPPLESPVTLMDLFVEVTVDDRYAVLDEQSGHPLDLSQFSDILAAQKPQSSFDAKVTESAVEHSARPGPGSLSAEISSSVDEDTAIDGLSEDRNVSGSTTVGDNRRIELGNEAWKHSAVSGFDVVQPQWHEEPVVDDVPPPACQPVMESADATGQISERTPLPPRRPYARLFSRLRCERL